jgi:hypothetical protein
LWWKQIYLFPPQFFPNAERTQKLGLFLFETVQTQRTKTKEKNKEKSSGSITDWCWGAAQKKARSIKECAFSIWGVTKGFWGCAFAFWVIRGSNPRASPSVHSFVRFDVLHPCAD